MTPRAYYNDNDTKVCAWVRELIKRGLIMDGDVDERSIKDVKPDELKSYTRIHLFCGIAGWDYALQLAGWPDEAPVLTNSCPCQSFSNAGKRKGTDDPRHLWPDAFRIIRGLRPVTIFGEQVEAAIRFGWLDGVFTDLEGEGYSCGAAVLGAHSVGAPHTRQRIYWVANSGSEGHKEQPSKRIVPQNENGADARKDIERSGGVGISKSQQHNGSRDTRGGWGESSDDGGVAHTGHGTRCAEQGNEFRERGGGLWKSGAGDHSIGGLANTIRPDLVVGTEAQRQAEPARSSWSEYETRNCIDGKSRRIEPGSAPLAHGVPARMVRLRGYGNAIVPQVASEFIKAARVILYID